MSQVIVEAILEVISPSKHFSTLATYCITFSLTTRHFFYDAWELKLLILRSKSTRKETFKAKDKKKFIEKSQHGL